jgi:hypothetical protein
MFAKVKTPLVREPRGHFHHFGDEKAPRQETIGSRDWDRVDGELLASSSAFVLPFFLFCFGDVFDVSLCSLRASSAPFPMHQY